MMNFSPNSASLSFRVNQIVCLEDRSNKLYGEVIQLIAQRNLCWFRPICLVIFDCDITDRNSSTEYTEYTVEVLDSPQDKSLVPLLAPAYPCQSEHRSPNSSSLSIREDLEDLTANDLATSTVKLIDLQGASDLLWPSNLFRPALDTEAIDFIVRLNNNEITEGTRLLKRRYLNLFVKQFWSANQDKF